ncbi:MAG: hypothetical protein DLM58_19420 [Pseudonocardiales bacterium]|nr:MAG: hypothetical protein DLM58_19420 [Pseudonocardiales bacterium]
MGQSRRPAVLGLLCVLLAVATGCDGSSAEPKHTFSPTATFSDPRGGGTPAPSTPNVATTGPNVRPGEKPPVLPAAAKTNTVRGATEFAKYWMEALDWGYATTDSGIAYGLYSPDCIECARFVGIIDAAKRSGKHFQGGRISLAAWIPTANDGRRGATQAVDVTYSQGAVKRVDGSGHVDGSSPALDNLVRRFWIKPHANSLTIVETKQVVRK